MWTPFSFGPEKAERRGLPAEWPASAQAHPGTGQLRTWAPRASAAQSVTSSRLGNPLTAPSSFLISLTRRPAPARKQLNSQPIGSGQRGDRDMYCAHRSRGTQHLCPPALAPRAWGCHSTSQAAPSSQTAPQALGSRLGWAKTPSRELRSFPAAQQHRSPGTLGSSPLSVSPFLFLAFQI